MVAAVLSGNRNFEGRIHPEVRVNYLASPPLVVAYALVGRMDIDLSHEPLGHPNGKPVFLADIWPTRNEIEQTIEKCVRSEMFQKTYADVYKGDERWRSLSIPEGDLYVWENDSTYVKHPPYFEDTEKEPAPIVPIRSARALAVLGDSITTDHISPAGSIKLNGPAGKYLIEQGVQYKDFNSYGARRGNHEVMIRGTFANVRLRNQLAPGTEGGVTRHLPDGEVMSIFDAARRYEKEGVALVILAGKRVRLGLVTRLGGEGAAPPRRSRRHRRELRAHSPLEPGRNGRLAAAIRRRRQREHAGAHRRRGLRRRGSCRRNGQRLYDRPDGRCESKEAGRRRA